MKKYTDTSAMIKGEIEDALSLLDKLRNDLGISNETVNAMLVLAQDCLSYDNTGHGYRIVEKARRYNLDIKEEYRVRAEWKL